MTDALKQEREAFETWAGDQGFIPNRTVVGDNYQDLRTQGSWEAWQASAALSAPQPAAPQADPCAPPEIKEAIERGEFEPGQWTVSAQRAIENNPSGALRIIAKLRDEVAGLKAALSAPQPAAPQAGPLTEFQIDAVTEAAHQSLRRACSGAQGQQMTMWHGIEAHVVRATERAHGIKQPGREA